MSTKSKKFNIKQTFIIQVIASFVVISLLIILGGILVFNVMGKDYSLFTAFGFIMTVYLAFITFQPASILFNVRKEFVEGKVQLSDISSNETSSILVNPWIRTIPLSATVAIVCTLIVGAIIYGFKWKPNAVVTIVLSMLYIVPHYLLTKRYIEKDIISFVNGKSKLKNSSATGYFWGTYVLPNIVFQSIINYSLGNRGFHHEAMKLTQLFPQINNMVPVNAVALDLSITFMFVCNFTFLAAISYTISGFYLGIITVHQKKDKPINGFLIFLIMLIIGLCFGICYSFFFKLSGIDNISIVAAMISKIMCVIIAVYAGSRMALGWTIKKITINENKYQS